MTRFRHQSMDVFTARKTPPDSALFGVDIPTGVNAGDSCVWYQAVDDSGFALSAAECIIASIIDPPAYGPADTVLPVNTRRVEFAAFEGSAVAVVYGPDACTHIGADAFRDCPFLTQIRLPKDCEIDPSAFDGCASELILYAVAGGSTEAWALEHNVYFCADNIPFPDSHDTKH